MPNAGIFSLFPSYPRRKTDLRHRDSLAIQISELSLEEALFRAVVSTGLIIPCQSTPGTEPEWDLGLRSARWDSLAVGKKVRNKKVPMLTFLSLALLCYLYIVVTQQPSIIIENAENPPKLLGNMSGSRRGRGRGGEAGRPSSHFCL